MDLYHAPGFLGTKAFFLSDLTLVLILLSSLLFTIGVILVTHKHISAHQWVQTAAAIINAIVVIWVMIGSFMGFTLPDIPIKIKEPSVWITTFHSFIGLIGFLLGMFVMLRGNGLMPKALQFNNYKRFMRISYAFYMISTILGVIVYTVFFV